MIETKRFYSSRAKQSLTIRSTSSVGLLTAFEDEPEDDEHGEEEAVEDN